MANEEQKDQKEPTEFEKIIAGLTGRKELPPELDTNPLKIDVRDFDKTERFFGKYEDGLEFRKQLGEKLYNATSIELVNLPDPNEDPDNFITVSHKFLVGLLGGYIEKHRGSRPIKAPKWFMNRLNMVYYAVTSDLTWLSDTITQLRFVCGNPIRKLDKVPGYDESVANEYDGIVTFLHQFEMEDPRDISVLHSYVCKLKEMLEDYEGVYFDRMCKFFEGYKGRWIRVTFGASGWEDEANDVIFPRIKYGNRTIVAKGLYAKIGESNVDGSRNELYPFKSDSSTPVFYVGFDSNDDDSENEVYPVLNEAQPVKCDNRYVELRDYEPSGSGHDGKYHDRWNILKEGVEFPTKLLKMAEKGKLNEVFNVKDKTFAKFEFPKTEK